ncbi:MAG: thioredoxin family protein [Candidatus Diapherotrites archaeon]|uniref:Thioredoxin family protein n=1 Tax=Candidatus Iainarchaeum sp. TaxID=3101447 RepID=A0A8T4L3M5_9ARCH|nr:thioredoxin family protein [Candidatus Diapherotrites archaeon]
MNRYVQAGLVTAAILAVVFATVWLMDDSRISVLNGEIDSLSLESETNRILFFHNQVFDPSESSAFCEVIDKSATIRSNEGDLFFSKLAAFENANLLGNYGSLKKKYLLNRIELWLYTTMLKQKCRTNVVSVLYFYRTHPPCAECQVQGEILEVVREKCPNVKIFALAVDEDVDLVPLIQAQYGVTAVPSLVIDNNVVLGSLTDQNKLLSIVSCDDKVVLFQN